MKTPRNPLTLARIWAAGVVTSLLLGGTSLAAETGEMQFSPSGAYAAKYATGASEVYIFGYGQWPQGAVTATTVKVAKPYSSNEDSNWRVLDDGSVWIADSRKLTRYAADGTPPQTVDMAPLLSSTLKFERVVMTSGPVPQILFLGTANSDHVYEIRCGLVADMFAAGGPARTCKGVKTFDSGGANEPYTDAGTQSFPFESMLIFAGPHADYSVISSYFWLRSYNGALSSQNRLSLYQFFKDGKSIHKDDSRTSDGSFPATNWVKWSIYGGYVIDDSDDTETIISRPDSSDDKITLVGANVRFSADGRFAMTTKPGTRGSSYLVRDLNKPSLAAREVLMPGEGAITVSPDNRFFIQASFVKPLPIGYLTDPYFGKSDEVVVDLLMARIVKMLGENRFGDALPAFTELEGRGGALPEDFYFYQADTLARAGRVAEAQKKADAFVARYGRKSKHYGRMIEILAQ
jgi:hypothetical protein